jgi:heme exporter protein C
MKNKLWMPVLLGLTFCLMTVALCLVFLYAPTEAQMGNAQRIFYFHVPLAWVGFLSFFIVFLGGIAFLWKGSRAWDAVADAAAEIGFLFTTLVLITGSIWAKSAWGIWWTWDARLTATLLLWVIYLVYLIVRHYAVEPWRGARLAAVVGIIGFVDVPVTFLAINLWRTQHPTALVFEGGLTGPMVNTLIVSIVAFTLFYVVLLVTGSGLKKAALAVAARREEIEETD